MAYTIQRTTINNSTWTPLIAPIACDAFSIRCDTDVVLMRSNPNDPNTQDQMALGSQEYVLVETPKDPRWYAGEIVLYLQAQTQAAPVVIAKFVPHR